MSLVVHFFGTQCIYIAGDRTPMIIGAKCLYKTTMDQTSAVCVLEVRSALIFVERRVGRKVASLVPQDQLGRRLQPQTRGGRIFSYLGYVIIAVYCRHKTQEYQLNSFVLRCGPVTVRNLTPLTMRFRES